LRGGKRAGAGAPAGPRLKPEERVRRITTTIAPDIAAYLDSMAAKGIKKAHIIDTAIRRYREKYNV